MRQKTKNKIRSVISLLLGFVLTTVFAAHESATAQHLEKVPKAVLLTPAFSASPFESALLNERTDFKFSDGLSKSGLILEQTSMDLVRVSVLFLTEFTNRFAQCERQTSIIIRAPPCPNS